MRIEKLEPSKHKQGRWLVWLEDASIVRVGEGDVVSLGLYAGKEGGPGRCRGQIQAHGAGGGAALPAAHVPEGAS